LKQQALIFLAQCKPCLGLPGAGSRKKGELLVVLPGHRDGGINTPHYWYMITVAANGTKGRS
jgi:hypothetical protein